MLWDVDYTLLNAAGLGNRLYAAVFKEMFGRDLAAVAPKAGRTDRAILLDTLALAGVAEPRAHVDDFLAALAADGLGIMLISSELEEILGLSHRVLVMRRGRIVAELEGDAMTEPAILAAAFADRAEAGAA